MIEKAVRVSFLCVLLATAASALADPASQPAPAGTPAAGPQAGDVYQRIADEYLKGNWDALEKDLKASAKDLSGLSLAQQADVKYVRQAMDECRPAWWAQCKAGQKVVIHPTVWGVPLTCTYDPAAQQGVQLQSTPKEKLLTVSWPSADMDNPQHAEHGFSKGDLNSLTVWNTLGTGLVWATLPPQALAAATDKDKTRLIRYLGFRGDVTGIYYGTPKARRWGLWLCLAAFQEKYAKMPTVETRKAIAGMFVAEVLADPAKYPSVKLPSSLAEDNAEGKLAEHFRVWVEKNTWTIPEDKTLREAIKAFAAANDKTVLQAEKVTLPNGQVHMIDTDADTPFRPKRDAWIKAQYDKTR